MNVHAHVVVVKATYARLKYGHAFFDDDAREVFMHLDIVNPASIYEGTNVRISELPHVDSIRANMNIFHQSLEITVQLCILDV